MSTKMLVLKSFWFHFSMLVLSLQLGYFVVTFISSNSTCAWLLSCCPCKYLNEKLHTWTELAPLTSFLCKIGRTKILGREIYYLCICTLLFLYSYCSLLGCPVLVKITGKSSHKSKMATWCSGWKYMKFSCLECSAYMHHQKTLNRISS